MDPRAPTRVATILVGLGFAQVVSAQTPGDSLASYYRLDLAVPDAPAFSLVEVGTGNILRPSSVREITSALSSFTSEGQLTVPRSLGIELSPGLLIGGRRLTLSTYQRRPWLYRLRVSAATGRASTEDRAARFALGVRASLIDASDVRTDQARLDRVLSLTRRIEQVYENALDDCPPQTCRPEDFDDLLTAEQRARLAALDDSLSAVLDEDALWNARALDVAIAVSASSADSVGNGLDVEEVAAWVTYAEGLGSWGQLLVGAQLASERDSTTAEFEPAGSLGSRLYYGANDYKGFVEVEARWADQRPPAYLFNGGAEIRMPWLLWLSLAAGVELSGGASRLVTDVSFKFGFPHVGG